MDNFFISEIEELRKNLKVSQKQLANCDKRLRGLQLGADLTENGKLDANSVYLRKIVEAMLNRFEGGIIAKEGKVPEIFIINKNFQTKC